MINVIVNADPKYDVDKLAIQSLVVDILNRYRVKPQVEVGINIVDNKKMHQINRNHRGISSTTNILTFPLEDGYLQNLQHIPKMGFIPSPDQVVRLGDIVISYPQIEDDAEKEGVSVDDEMRILLEHGVNHLLGIHH